MCGIFGIFNNRGQSYNFSKQLSQLALLSRRRGQDSSGLIVNYNDKSCLHRSDCSIASILKSVDLSNANFAIGHTRLITNSLTDNQPISRFGMHVIHNGIIINHEALWEEIDVEANQKIDSEILLGLCHFGLTNGVELDRIPSYILEKVKGTVSAAILIPSRRKLLLFSNNGSLYYGSSDAGFTAFASEESFLKQIHISDPLNVPHSGIVLDIPSKFSSSFTELNVSRKRSNIVPSLGTCSREESLLIHKQHSLRRCSKCILPETMPYIDFDDNGVCNYCRSYKTRNSPKPISELIDLVEPYKRDTGNECIVPFSGGRDSSFGLHLIKNHLNLKPVTYTYDWGMVTDLARRNISRMCSEMGIENIIVAANIDKKRKNIKRNFTAWLHKPNLGMVSILTSGDKHFYRHIKTIQKEVNISLNLWSVNPLEVTYFKAGFLGVPPDFSEEKVYTSKLDKQLFYQKKRFKAMFKNPRYFNSSLLDTFSGEYYRSISSKRDYFHTFDYYSWDESEIDDLLINKYGWETAPDTRSTWRIGDGTAAMYNYIYYTMAGFSEHDTFRSNQIREGQLNREQALALVQEENKPRYPNIKWYLDAVNMNFEDVISRINNFSLPEQ